MTSAAFRLTTLGELRLTVDGREVLSGRRKDLVLLARLARAPGHSISREELAAALWGDRIEERARQSLRQSLVQLRRIFGDSLVVTAAQITIAGESFELDAKAFEDDIAAGRLADAIARWRGEFLIGTEDVGAEPYRTWLEQERLALRRALVSALRRLVTAATESRDTDAELRLATRWTTVAPFDEEAHRAVLAALLRAGRNGDARDHYAALLRNLRHEAGDEPSAALLTLGESIAAREQQVRARQRASSVAVLTPDFVGRGAELQSLVEAWDRARQGSGVATIVEGEEGMGKTRLCRELVRHAAASGESLVLQARAADGDPTVPDASARRLFAGLSEAVGLGGIHERSLAILATLLPDLRQRFARLPEAGAVGADAAAIALGEALEAVAEDAPVLVVADDLHRFDGESRGVLLALLRRPPRGVVVAVTALTGSISEQDVAGDLAVSPVIERLKLQPLSVVDAGKLAESMIALAAEDRERLLGQLYRETGGVPLYLVELITSLADSGALSLDERGVWRLSSGLADGGLPLPARARSAIRMRIGQLSPGPARLLNAAAVIGRRADAALLEATSKLESHAFTGALDDLIVRRLVRATGGEEAAYELPHEVLRRTVYESIPPRERRQLHRAALDAIARRSASGALDDEQAHHRNAARRAGGTPARRWILRLAGGVAAGALALAGVRISRATDTAADARRLVVAAFENQTGNPAHDVLGRIAADWLTQGASRTTLVRVAPPLLMRAESASGPAGRAARLRQLAAEARADLLVWGAYYVVNDSLRFEPHVVDVRSGDELAPVEPALSHIGEPLVAVEALRQRVLGALAPWVDRRLVAAARVQSRPPNLEAYRVFAQGMDLYYARQGDRAIPYYLRAYAIDTTFTLPLLYAIVNRMGIAHYAAAESLTKVLLPRRSELAPYDRLLLDLQVASLEGDKAAIYTAARAANELAPGSYAAMFLPSAAIGYNRPREALSHMMPFDTTRGEGSHYPGYWSVVSTAAHMAGEYVLQLQAGHIVRSRFRYDPRYLHYEARALAALGRMTELDALLTECVTWPTITGWGPPGIRVYLAAHDELLAHGYAERARIVLERGVRYYENAPADVKAIPKHRFDMARALYRLGRLAAARAIFEALKSDTTVTPVSIDDLNVHIGYVAARQGDSARVAEVDRWLQDKVPYRGAIRVLYRAWLAASMGDREAAMRLYRQALSEGAGYSDEYHSAFELSSLRGYAPFEELMRPKG
jgi:DNA-binding SARP family transcriptional activator